MTNNSTNPTVSNNSTTSAPPSTNNNSSSSNNNNNKNHASFLPESVTTDLQRLILSVRPSETPKLVSIVSKHLTDVVSVAFPKPNTPPSVASTPTNTSNLSSDGEGGNNNNNNSSTISPTLSPATTTTGPALGGYDTRARSAVDLLCAVATCESLDNGARDVAREVLKLIHTDNIARLRGSNLAVARFTRVLLECYTDDYEGVTSALDDYFMESSNAVNVWLSMVAKHPQFGELILQLWGIGLGASSAVAASPSMFAIPWVKQQAHTKLISMLGDAIKEEDELPLFTFVQEIFQRGLNAHVGHFVDHILLGNCGESFIDAVIKAAEDVADGTLTHASAPCLPEALALLSSMLSMLQRSSVSQTSFQGDYYRTLRTNTTVQAFIDRLPRLSALLNSDALAARPGAFGSSRLRIVDACMTLFRFSRHDSDRALFDVKFITQLFSLCESFPNHDVVLGALAEICTEAIVRTIDDGKLEQYLVDECHLQDRLVQWVRDEKWANTSLRALALTVSFGLVQKAIKRVSDDDEDDENEDEEEEDDEADQKMNVSDVDDDSSSKKKKNNNNNKKKSKSHDDDGDDEIQSIDEIEIEGEAEDFDEPVVEEDDGDDFTEQRQTESHEIDDDDNGKVTRWTISTTTLFRTYSKSGKVIKKRLSTTKRKTYPSAPSSKSDSSSSSSSSSDDEEDQHDHDDVLDSPALREAMKSDKKKNKKKNKKNNNNKNNDQEDDDDGENDENDNKNNNNNGETLTVATLSSEAVDKMSTFSNASKAWKNFVADDMREIWRDWFHEITGFRFQEPKSAGGKQVLHRPVVNLTRGSQQYQNRYGLNNNNNNNSNKTSEIGGDSENEKENGEEDGNQQALSFRSEAQSRKRAAAAAARRNARLGNMASYNLDTVIDVENGNKVISSRSSAYAASSKDNNNSENGNNNDDDEEIVVTSPTDQEMMKFEDLRRKHDDEDENDQEEDGSKTPPSSPSAAGKGKIILKDNEFDMNIGDEDDEEDDELTDLSTTTGEENGNGESSSKSNNNNNHNSGPPQRHRRTHSGHQESESIFDDVNNPTSSTADQQHSDPMSSFMNSRRPKTAPMPRGKNSVQNQNISRILREQEEQEEEERRQQQQQQQSQQQRQQHIDVSLDLDVDDEDDVNHQMAHSEEEDSHQQQQDDEWVEKFITEVENENQNTNNNNNEPTSQHQGDDDEELEIDLNVDDDEVAEMNHEPDGEEKQNVSRASTATTTESSSSEPVVVTSSGTLQRKDDDDDDW